MRTQAEIDLMQSNLSDIWERIANEMNAALSEGSLTALSLWTTKLANYNGRLTMLDWLNGEDVSMDIK